MKEEIEQEEDFIKLYELVGKDITLFKKRLEKSLITPSQIKILWGYHAYRKRDQKKALDLLKSSPLTSPFIEGVRLYLLGLTYNHIGKFSFARDYLTQARAKFSLSKRDNFKILNLATLLFCYGNQSLIKQMGEIIDELETINPINEYEKILKVLCKATFLSDSGQFEQANKFIEKALITESEYSGVFEASFRLLKINNYFHLDKIDQCRNALDDYNKATGFKCNSNFRFIKILLEHIIEGQVLYVYKYDFEDSQEQYDQLMVIKSLAEDNQDEAKRYWELLRKHNPEVYLEHFVYQGDAVFFKVALQKNLASVDAQLNLEHLSKLATIQEKLEYIFENGPDKIKKERLIFLLWGEEDSAEARSKLRRALQYFQQKRAVKIKSFQDCYQKMKKVS